MANPGLSNVQVEETPVEPTVEPRAPLSAQAVKATGPYALPTTKTVSGVDPDLLENMRQLIAEREAQKGGFMENLKDATAWWSGGMNGPSAALGQRAKEREEFNATTFGMKRDLAQNKIAQQQAQSNQEMIFGKQAPTTGTTESGQQMAGVAPTMPQGGLLGLVKDPGLRQSIAVEATRDQAGAFKSIQNYLAKNAEDPTMVKELKYMVDNGLIDKNLVPAAVLTKFVGSGAFVPHDVRGVGGTGQSTPFGSANAMSPTGAPAAKLPTAIASTGVTPAAPTQAPAAAPAVPAAAAPTQAPAAAQVLPHTKPLPKIEAPTATALAPGVTPRVASPFNPGTKEDLEFQGRAADVPLAGGKEFAQITEKLNATKAAQVDTAGLSSGERKVRFNDIKAVTEDPDMQRIFGLLAKKGFTPFALKQLESGVNVGQFGTMGVANLERNLMEVGATKEQIEKLHRVEKSLGAAELDYAKTYLTGQGAVSDNERKLVKDAVGSVKDPAKVLNMQASVMAERAEFDEKVAAAYNKYRDTQGEYASFGKFMRSPEAVSAISEHNKKLAQIIGRKPNELSDPFNSKGPQESSSSVHPGKSLVNQYLTGGK